MILELSDRTNYVTAEGHAWTVRSRTGAVHPVKPYQWVGKGKGGSASIHTVDRKLTELHYGSVRDLGVALLSHNLIQPKDLQTGAQTRIDAEATEKTLRMRGLPAGSFITFGSGAFVVEPRLGDWHLRNPLSTVRRISGDVVGYCPSLAAALVMAVERTLQADSRTIPYTDLDRTLWDIARRLWHDVQTVRPDAVPRPGNVGVGLRKERGDSNAVPLLN